jgi:hypothetical protein
MYWRREPGQHQPDWVVEPDGMGGAEEIRKSDGGAR